ncbi:class I SAM-dependent methyltransferase [Pseudomonadota bacterium]
MTDLVSNNNLIRQPSGVWCAQRNQKSEPFTYSDGDEVEDFIKQIIAQANDRSSLSQELDQKIVDWSSEYHFSSVRANLLRPLELGGVSQALELGCGCGSITRYLGELGIEVDAIEGSLRRAEIARLRCAELDNINIINQNFNLLELPGKTYDSVFLVGVLEYAKRFYPSATSDRDALLQILAAAQSVLKSEGAVIIAIENRVGLKYLMGASEDHYGIPNIGLYNYPEKEGTKTYDLNEWEEILTESGFNSHQILYPFPDYKLPFAVISRNFLNQFENAHSIFYGMRSRDYLCNMDTNIDEFLFWKIFHQIRQIEKFSNSFLIVAGNDAATIEQMAGFDFVHFSNPTRKNQFRNITRKNVGQSVVTKEPLFASTENQPTEGIRQIRDVDTYQNGMLLADIWCQELHMYCDIDRFDELVKQYYAFLLYYARTYGQDNNIFDVLPSNIILDGNGNYVVIDKEWILQKQLSPEFVLVRALYFFATHNRIVVKKLFHKYKFENIRKFLLHCLKMQEIAPEKNLQNFIDTENYYQDQIHAYRIGDALETMLDIDIVSPKENFKLYPILYWANQGEPFDEIKFDTKPIVQGVDAHTFTFKLPKSVANAERLRFDPAETEGFFRIYSLSMEILDKDGAIVESILNCKTGSDIENIAKLESISHYVHSHHDVFVAKNCDPQFIFKLPEKLIARDDDSIQFKVTMDWPMSLDFDSAQQGFLDREEKLLEIINGKREEILQLEKLKEELQLIKNSRLWKVFDKVQQIAKKYRN